MMPVAVRRALYSAPFFAFAACSAELPATSIRPLQEDGQNVLDADGNEILVRHVRRDGEWVACDDADGARKLVTTSSGTLQYVGQGLVNQTCARGQCHASSATGALRSGAPAGLDFELPLAPLVLDEGTNSLSPDPQASVLLGVHQRRVYDERGSLWEQIDSGRMPPGGVGSPYREAPPLTYVTLDEAGACAKGEAVGPVLEADSKEEIAIWLACGAPVVEASDERVSSQVLGTVGNILPTCVAGGDEPPPPDTTPTFDEVYETVLGPECGAPCHNPNGLRPDSNYGTMQDAFDNLVMVEIDPTCDGAEQYYVVPGDPEASYLLHKMGDPELSSRFICDSGALMPLGAISALPTVDLVRAWIEGGAPGPGETPAASGDAGAGDASAGDAGVDGGE